MGAILQQTLFYGAFGLVAIALIVWFVWDRKQKKTFVTPVTLYKLRADGGFKEYPNLLGGVVKLGSGVKDFKIKMPKQMAKHSLGYMPDFSLASADDRLCFVQHGDGTMWQQCNKRLVTYQDIEKTDENGEQYIERYSLLIEPIPTDVKTATINNIHDVRNMLDKNRLTAYGITILGFVIMVIAHLISLWIHTKVKCNLPG